MSETPDSQAPADLRLPTVSDTPGGNNPKFGSVTVTIPSSDYSITVVRLSLERAKQLTEALIEYLDEKEEEKS